MNKKDDLEPVTFESNGEVVIIKPKRSTRAITFRADSELRRWLEKKSSELNLHRATFIAKLVKEAREKEHQESAA